MRETAAQARAEIRVCIDCEGHFEIEPGEIRFFAKKELPLPRRCVGCRRSRRGIGQAVDCGGAVGRETYEYFEDDNSRGNR